MVTINSYSMTTSWNWEQVTKMKLGPKVDIGHDCVVTMQDAYTNDNIHDCVVTLHKANTNDNMTTVHINTIV